jgi:hypothetical protein
VAHVGNGAKDSNAYVKARLHGGIFHGIYIPWSTPWDIPWYSQKSAGFLVDTDGLLEYHDISHGIYHGIYHGIFHRVNGP